MVDNIVIQFECGVRPAKKILVEILNSFQNLNIDWDMIETHLFNTDYVQNHQSIILAVEDFVKNRDKEENNIYCSKEFLEGTQNILLIKDLSKEGLYIEFVCKAPNFTLEQFHYYEQFFYNIYQSLDSKIYYKSFVGVASKRKFYRENGLMDINFYTDPFLEEDFFYRCLTPKSSYGKWHTKEQLLQAPFFSIKELDDEVLEIIQFEQPIDITNMQHIENMRSLQSYLSQHNTYPEE